MTHLNNGRAQGVNYFCDGAKNKVEYWDCEPLDGLPKVAVKYTDHEYNLREIYCLDDDFDHYFAPSNYGSYSELCNELQEFISASCFAVTIENDKRYDPEYKGVIADFLYKKEQSKNMPFEVANRDSLEILFNTYLRGSRRFTYQQ
ncbi:MAG: hypothetical protein WD512_07150, partial [Candidatus Paceibacterota bacterium]